MGMVVNPYRFGPVGAGVVYPYTVGLVNPGYETGLVAPWYSLTSGVPVIITNPVASGTYALSPPPIATAWVGQSVDIPADLYADIDAGLVDVTEACKIAGWAGAGGNDAGGLAFDFRDASNARIGVSIGPRRNYNTTVYASRSYKVAVPQGTRKIVASFTGYRTVSGSNNDVYVDDWLDLAFTLRQQAQETLFRNAATSTAGWTTVAGALIVSAGTLGLGGLCWNGATGDSYLPVNMPVGRHAEIDAGNTRLCLDLCWSSFTDADAGRSYVEFYDVSNAIIGARVYQEPADVNWLEAGEGRQYNDIPVPPNTRSMRFGIVGTRFTGTELSSYLLECRGFLTKKSGTTIDLADTDANITLSNGDKTALSGTTGFKSARLKHGKGTGKWRFQVTIDAMPATEIGIGVSGPFYPRGTYLGYDRQGIGYIQDNRVVYNSSTYGAGPGAYAAGDVIDVYVDADARIVWFAKNGVVLGDPTAGTGGYSLHASFLPSIFPHLYLYGNGCQVTIETDGAWAYPGAHPSFQAWSAEQATTKANALGLLIVSRGPAIFYGHTIGEIGLRATSGGANWLIGGTASAYGAAQPAANAVDGNPLTFWEHSPGGGANQYPSWIAAYAAAPGLAEYVMVQARSGNIGEELQAPTLSDLYLSADGVNYDKVQIGYDWGAWTGVPSGTPGQVKEHAIPDF